MMQDHFLFDDADPKQRGKGCDKLGSSDDGLQFKWRWVQVRMCSWAPSDPRQRSNARRPCQTCEAGTVRITGLPSEGRFELKAIFWHTEYEAVVTWNGEYIVRQRGFLARLDAQRRAEELLEEFLVSSLTQVFDYEIMTDYRAIVLQ